MRLTLIRHGLTEWNRLGRFQGHSDVPLSDEGVAQSTALAGYTAAFSAVDALYASDLQRAKRTAEIAFPDLPIVLDARLRELHFGGFEGSTLQELLPTAAWSDWIADPYSRHAPGGEAYLDLRRRASAWLAEVRLRHASEHVVAVTHSGTIQMLLAELLGVEHPRWRKRVYVRHTSVTHILFRGADAIIERVNDTRHLVPDGADPFGE